MLNLTVQTSLYYSFVNIEVGFTVDFLGSVNQRSDANFIEEPNFVMQYLNSVTRSLIPGVLRLNSLRFSPMIAPLNLIRSFFVAAMPLSYVYVNASPGIGPLCRGVSTMLFQNDGSGRSTGRNSGHSKFSSVLYSSTSFVEKEDVGLDDVSK